MQIDPGFREVHESNMSKMDPETGKAIKAGPNDPDGQPEGKVLKGPNYFIADQGLDYNHGNVIKYVTRAGKKNPEKELEDLEKAAAYLQMVYNVAQGLPAVVRDPETREVVWSLFRN